MRKILHVVVSPPDSTAQNIISAQKTDPQNEITVADLTQADPDYARVVQLIFESDSIHTW